MLVRAAELLDGEFDVCIVGTGPAGIACGLDLSARGMRVLMLEAGAERPVPGNPDILAAEISDAAAHDPTDIVAASALGGSSHWWGGRSVPFDAADFAAWPIPYAEMLDWYGRGADFLGAKGVSESPAPGAFAKLAGFDAVRDETWCPQIDMSKRWRTQLRSADGPNILLGARVTGLVHEAGRIAGVEVRSSGETRVARAKRYILTCGGLGTLRLLLLAQRDNPALFGGPDGILGRGYMGHLTGAVADLELADAANAAAFSARRIDGDIWGRRRIIPQKQTVDAARLANIAFWLDNASNDNAAHGSALASAKYLAARALRGFRGEGALTPHIANVSRAPFSAAFGLTRTAYWLAMARVTGRMPRPTLTLPSGERRWQLHYHAEQFADPANRITLSRSKTDSVGLPALSIDFRFGDRDVESVVRAHALLDRDMQAAGAGRVHLRAERSESLAAVRGFARDGYHQLGGAVMSADANAGVVDTQCRAHDLENLWIVSGSVFPSGGQANPTLTIVSLARRLAAHLTRQ